MHGCYWGIVRPADHGDAARATVSHVDVVGGGVIGDRIRRGSNLDIRNHCFCQIADDGDAV